MICQEIIGGLVAAKISDICNGKPTIVGKNIDGIIR